MHKVRKALYLTATVITMIAQIKNPSLLAPHRPLLGDSNTSPLWG